MINLTIFNNNLFDAGTEFFSQLGIRLNSNTAVSLGARELLKDQYKDKDIFNAITETYFLGLVDDSVFDGNTSLLLSTARGSGLYSCILSFMHQPN